MSEQENVPVVLKDSNQDIPMSLKDGVWSAVDAVDALYLKGVMVCEQEAWSILAEYWGKAKECVTDWVLVTINDSDSAGLCSSIGLLKPITEYKTRSSMMDKIEVLDWRSDGYVWPTTLEGAKQRVEFCLKMVGQTGEIRHES